MIALSTNGCLMFRCIRYFTLECGSGERLSPRFSALECCMQKLHEVMHNSYAVNQHVCAVIRAARSTNQRTYSPLPALACFSVFLPKDPYRHLCTAINCSYFTHSSNQALLHFSLPSSPSSYTCHPMTLRQPPLESRPFHFEPRLICSLWFH